jgi:carbon-monoxide dehydrogenase iron sulfur subunit
LTYQLLFPKLAHLKSEYCIQKRILYPKSKWETAMYKLSVIVERIDGYCNQPMLIGDSFTVEGGKIRIPDGKHICMWALQSMMPIFPLLQRAEPQKGDWTSKTGQVFVCPDPKGKVHYRIERILEE